MKKIKVHFLILTLGIAALSQCEKDDICLEGTPATPKMIIRFFEEGNPDVDKIAEGLQVRAIETEAVFVSSSSDSIGLPLNAFTPFTQFEFTQNLGADNEKVDTLQFNYSRNDIYINRACGFKGTFIFESPGLEIVNPGDNWIQGYTVIKDTIADETGYHLAIYH